MSNHPLNLALRFVLELVGLYALGYWAWTQHTDLERVLWTAGLPLLAAVLWGTFRVNNDPGKAPVEVPGLVRLLLEAIYFGGAVWAFYAAGRPSWGLVLALVLLGHYAISYDRVLWLLKQ